MKTFQILVVEDDQSIRNLISVTLKVHDYLFLTAATGKKAILLSVSQKPDLILLDLGLPDMDGIEVIRTVRSWSQLPIIVISARGEETDKILALDTGADDYLTKPFSTEELMARIRVAQRRLSYIENSLSESCVFQNKDLEINFEKVFVSCKGKEVHLTATEYRLLKLLAMNAGKVLTYSMIIREIWGGNVETDIVSLRVHMATLRKKLSIASGGESFIKTHVGIGYSMAIMK